MSTSNPCFLAYSFIEVYIGLVEVDAIILTGGIAYGNRVTDAIAKYVDWIAPVIVYPGEDELLALAQGGLRVLNGEEEAKDY